MKTFKQFLLEQTIPNPVGYSPQYNVTPQQAVGHVYQVAKILDPTGVLSYEDIPPAVDNFNKQPTSFNALMMLLALAAAIPLAGKIAAPLKIAAKAGNYNKVIQITPYVARKIIELVEKNSGNLSRLNIPPETIQKAKQIVQTAKAEEMMPASVFNQMVKDFKAGGGQITKVNKEIGSSYDPGANKIQIEPAGRTRATFAHEYGHHLASNTPGTYHTARRLQDIEKLKPGFAQDAAAEISKTGSIDSTQKKLGLWQGLAKEREANTMAINTMKKFGATPTQIAAYERTMGPAFKTYKITAGRDLSRLQNIITKNIDLPPEGKEAVKNMISLADMEAFARISQQPGLLQKLDANPFQYPVIRIKFLDQVLKQKAATDDVYKLIYKEYKKALSTVDDTTAMIKPKGVGLSNATTFTK